MAKLKTGRHTGAIKSHRQSERRAAKNRAVKKRIRAAVKDFLELVQKKDAAGAKKMFPEIASLWDKAAKTGIVHHRAAARHKSRLALKAKALTA